MGKNLLTIGVFMLLTCFSIALQAQSGCTQTLRQARSTYDQGRLHELPEMLSGCLQHGFTQQEKVEAYKLLTLAYIYLEEPAKADEAMVGLLETDPYFEVNTSADPAEFVALYNTFRTWPVYRLGARVGVNATNPFVVSSASAIEGSTTEYKPGIRFQAGLFMEIPLSKKLTLQPAIDFQNRSFDYKSVLAMPEDDNTSEGKEVHSWLSLPVLLQYTLSQKSKLSPYVAVGVSVDYLVGAKLDMNRIRINATSTQDRSYDITPYRENMNINALAAFGIKARLGSGYVVTELRAHYGLVNVSRSNTAYAIDDYLLFDAGYADNVFRLNGLSITAGYCYNVFHPKKLKNKK